MGTWAKSRSKKSHSRSKRSRSKSDRSVSREKSESRSPAKKVDLEDKDVKRLRKRSHSSRDNKRSVSRGSKRSPSKDIDRTPSRKSNSLAKKVRRSHSGGERSTSRASEDRNGSMQEEKEENGRQSSDVDRSQENND